MEMERLRDTIKLALCGDVMLGRGIDQILPHPCDPRLYEGHARSALDYVAMAERAHGPVRRPVEFAYVWGDALSALEQAKPDVRIINLETSVTRRGRPAPKGVNYRMSPENIGCLSAAKIDCCTLANNHVLDWGPVGLLDTLQALENAQVRVVGAGNTAARAVAPIVLGTSAGGTVIVFGFATESSGIPAGWAAGPNKPGVSFLHDLSKKTALGIAALARPLKRPGVALIASIHWGENWGYPVPDEQRQFAHALIDEAGFDLIHGHSSHHPKAMEVYRDRLILYGCGDFLNDYEGIAMIEPFRDDLAVLYLPLLLSDGTLLACEMQLFEIYNFRLRHASIGNLKSVQRTLDRESTKFGARVELLTGTRLTLHWH